MLCDDGKTSVYSFLGTSIPFLILFVPETVQTILTNFSGGFYYAPIIYFILINSILRYSYRSNSYQIAIRGAFLGFIFALGIYIHQYCDETFCIFGIYMVVMSIFHFTEFLVMAIIQPKLVTTDSFIINHSIQYTIAAISSWIEFASEAYLLPSMKTYHFISYIGIFMCISGDSLRKFAMFTAKTNFNHLVQCEKADDHVLVTNGVYSLFRHPSYVGWFYWSIGTQIILLNPVCVILYTIASWMFFNERIRIEEICLLNFFGQQYCDYQQKVSSGLPFINGYLIKP